jgi:protein phosphatase
MLKIVEQAYRTDTGRQRNANEDAYFARPPVFAVADGMGGAQAGEVASRLAAESFDAVQRGEEAPEAYLRAIAHTANARIHRLAQKDSSRSGMGTTLTAALVEGDEVGFAHVGDSRGYVFRDGELKLLTSDHSLVEELRRQGRLTDEQAEDHPQRSIITRALGPEREVEVDTMTYQARPGDVYLLASDGLTTMIRDDRIASVIAEADSLDEALSQLVREANEAGGRDNITIVAFRLDEAETPAERKEGETLVGPSAEEAGLTADALRAAASRRSPASRDAAPGRRASEHGGRRGRLLRSGVRVAVAIAITVGLAAIAVWGLHQIYFLGGDAAGRLALYRGLPYDLPLGIELYSEVYTEPVQVSAIPAARRESAIGHTLRTHDDAVSLLQDLSSASERTANVRHGPPAERKPQGKAKPPAKKKSGGAGSGGKAGQGDVAGGSRSNGGGG